MPSPALYHLMPMPSIDLKPKDHLPPHDNQAPATGDSLGLKLQLKGGHGGELRLNPFYHEVR